MKVASPNKDKIGMFNFFLKPLYPVSGAAIETKCRHRSAPRVSSTVAGVLVLYSVLLYCCLCGVINENDDKTVGLKISTACRN